MPSCDARAALFVLALFAGSVLQATEQVPDDPDAPEGLAETLPGEPWSTYPGFDREAIGAVRDYPWSDGEREIDLTQVDLPRGSPVSVGIFGKRSGEPAESLRMSTDWHSPPAIRRSFELRTRVGTPLSGSTTGPGHSGHGHHIPWSVLQLTPARTGMTLVAPG